MVRRDEQFFAMKPMAAECCAWRRIHCGESAATSFISRLSHDSFVVRFRGEAEACRENSLNFIRCRRRRVGASLCPDQGRTWPRLPRRCISNGGQPSACLRASVNFLTAVTDLCDPPTNARSAAGSEQHCLLPQAVWVFVDEMTLLSLLCIEAEVFQFSKRMFTGGTPDAPARFSTRLAAAAGGGYGCCMPASGTARAHRSTSLLDVPLFRFGPSLPVYSRRLRCENAERSSVRVRNSLALSAS
jgi:hypothetical protein